MLLEGNLTLFHLVFAILERRRRGAVSEAYTNFIRCGESCDSLEPRFSGLSVGVSFTLGAWMTGSGGGDGGSAHTPEGFV